MSEKNIVKKVTEMEFLNELKTQIIDINKSSVVLDFRTTTGIESIIIDKATMAIFIEAYINASKQEDGIKVFRKNLLQ